MNFFLGFWIGGTAGVIIMACAAFARDEAQ
jgi:hypothetical protein